ncbi:uncharacterized protein LOC127554209 isoform X1 [Antechinus flavipes]|uniref:uncharacterized protein LOC127554209 isoform X1 n=1 Tax=Antechinus flavipes TaxID=38775 RepID=UPI00223627D0|nr:uncharacterized protein LOC127554209 isoform X1 [Antechinus flavipes]
MEKKTRILPKELILCPRKGLYPWTSSIILSRPQHRIALKWKQGQRSIEHTSHLSHQARTTQSFHPSKWTESKPEPWIKHLIRSPHHPHTNHMSVPLPYLQQQARTKSTLHIKKNAGISVMTLPRPKVRAKKTDKSLRATKHRLILPPSSKHQPESRLNPDPLSPGDPLNPDHLPKIFPSTDHPMEDLIPFQQKLPSRSISSPQIKIPPSSAHRSKADAESQTCPGSQAVTAFVPMSPCKQAKTSPKSKRQVKTSSSLARLYNHEPKATAAPSSSFPDDYLSRAPALKSSGPVGKASKESRTHLRSTIVMSLLRLPERQPRASVTMSSSQLNQRTRCKTASQTEKRYRSNTQGSIQAEKRHREIMSASTDYQTMVLLNPDQGTALVPLDLDTKKTILPDSDDQVIPPFIPDLDQVTPPFIPDLDQVTPPFIPDLDQVTPPFIPDLDQAEAKDIPKVNIHTFPAELSHDEKVAYTTDKQDMTVTGQDHRATSPLRLDQPEKSLSGLDCVSTSPPGSDQQAEKTQDFREQESWEEESPKTDQQTIILTNQEAKSPEIDHQTIILVDWEAKSPKTDQQTIILTDQELGAKFSLTLDQEDNIQTGPELLDTLHLRMDHKIEEETPGSTVHFSIQFRKTDQEKLEKMPSKPHSQDTTLTVWDNGVPVAGLDSEDNITSGPENKSSAPASPDHHEDDILEHNAHVLFPVEINPQETISEVKDDQQIMEPVDWDFWESPLSPIISNQETLIDSNCWDTPSPHPDHQTANRSDSNTITAPQTEECWETLPRGSDHKAITSSNVAHRTITSPLSVGPQDKFTLPSSDHQTTLCTNLEHWAENISDPISHVSLQVEQESWEITPFKNDDQDKTLSNQDYARPPVGLDQKDNILSDLNYQSISSTSSENPADAIAHILLQIEQQHPETMAAQQDIDSEVQNHPSISTLSLEPQYSIPFDPMPEATLPSSHNKQKKDIQVVLNHSSTSTEPEHWAMRHPRTHQATTQTSQHKRAIPLHSDPQDTSLDVLKCRAISLPTVDHKVKDASDPQTQATPLSDFQILSVELDHKVTLSTPKSQVFLPCSSEKQTETTFHSTKIHSKLPRSLFHTHKTLPGANYRLTPPLGAGHQSEPSKSQSYQSKIELSSKHQDQLPTRFQSQTQIVRNRRIPWCLNYIKPYNVEGGFVPNRIIQTIINSIPQQEIKNDICKQILLRRMRVSPLFHKDGRLFTTYTVCLICTSWIPNGCSHMQDMRHPCEARLLAIPTPLPGPKEELGVRFVLQVPKGKFPVHKQPNTHSKSHRPLYHPSGHPLHCSSPPLSPAKERLLQYMLSKDPHLMGRNSSKGRSLHGGEKRKSSKGEGLKPTKILFKSLRELFQMKQKKH